MNEYGNQNRLDLFVRDYNEYQTEIVEGIDTNTQAKWHQQIGRANRSRRNKRENTKLTTTTTTIRMNECKGNYLYIRFVVIQARCFHNTNFFCYFDVFFFRSFRLLGYDRTPNWFALFWCKNQLIEVSSITVSNNTKWSLCECVDCTLCNLLLIKFPIIAYENWVFPLQLGMMSAI